MDQTNRPVLQYKDVPGKVNVRIVDFEDGDPQHQLPNGQGNRGLSIAQLHTSFGGDEGEIRDPLRGELHHISLKPWSHKDPEKTFLHIGFRFTPDDPNFKFEPPATNVTE